MKQIFKQILCSILALMLSCSMLPAVVFAQEEEPENTEEILDEEIENSEENPEILENNEDEEILEIREGIPYRVSENTLVYDVSIPHVLINQAYTSAKGGYTTRGFVELYNPTYDDIDLTGWSIQYKSSEDGGSQSWSKHDLSGIIPAKSSYLIACANVAGPISGALTISNYDEEWNQAIYNKGFSLVLVANTEQIPNDSIVFDNTNREPLIEGYVDSLGVSGNDGLESQKAPVYEKESSAVQSKKKTIRRIRQSDTDNNSVKGDFMSVDYSFMVDAYRNWIQPKCAQEGEWQPSDPPCYEVSYQTNGGSEIPTASFPYTTKPQEPEAPVKEGLLFTGWYSDEACTIPYTFTSVPEADFTLYAGWSENPNAEWVKKIEELKESIPQYVESYFTKESVDVLKEILSKIEETDLENISGEEIEALANNLEQAINDLEYITGIVPQVYISTDEQVGNELTKPDGYVYTTLVVAEKDKDLIKDETAQIKVRGNSTALAEKKPFNIKFSKSQNVGGMGAAKKWCLLANCFDPTLIRNYMALDLAKTMGLAYTPDQRICEVWMDGVYKGCYLITEAVEVGPARVDIDLLNGEFIIEEETNRVEAGTTYLHASNGLRFAIKEPEEGSAEQISVIQQTIDSVAQALDSNDYNQVQKYVDVQSFAKLYLLDEYLKTVDVGFSSVYFYCKNGVLYAGPAWDFDLSSGNGSDPMYYDKQGNSYTGIYADKTWFGFLLQYREFKKEVLSVFEQYRPYLQSMYENGGIIDHLTSEYGSVFKKNFEEGGWNVSKSYSYLMRKPDSTYEENVKFLRTWLNLRMNWLLSTFYGDEDITILSQSKEIYSELGDKPDIYVEARGNYLSYHWYYKYANSNKWLPWISFHSPSLSINSKSNWDGLQIYCEMEDIHGNTKKSEVMNVHLHIPLVILKQPKAEVVQDKKPVSTQVEVNKDNVTYQWYVKKKGAATFSEWVGQKASHISATANSTWDGMQVYCIITAEDGETVQSETITYVLGTPLSIVKQPMDTWVRVGTRPLVSIEALGDGLTYQWYVKKSTSSVFSLWNGQVDTKLNTAATESWEGMETYCLITDQYGYSLQSNTIMFHLGEPICILEQPNNVIVKAEQIPQLFVEVTPETCSYQWYIKKAGMSNYIPWTGQTKSWITARANETWDGMYAYCLIQNEEGQEIISRSAKISVGTPIEILNQPMDTYVQINQKPNLSIKAQGNDLSYQWYLKKKGAGSFMVWTNQIKDRITVSSNETWDGMQVYCKLSDADGNVLRSEIATIHIGKTLNILEQPNNVIIAEGSLAPISTKGEGENLSYQWYYKKASMTTFKEWSGQNKDHLTALSNATWDQMQVYCKIRDSQGSVAYCDTVKITIGEPMKILVQPRDTTFVAGKVPNLSLIAQGENLSYQWYIKKKTATKFSVWSGQTQYKISALATDSWEGMQVYCKINDKNGNVLKSNIVTLHAGPTISIIKDIQDVLVNDSTSIHLKIETNRDDVQYQWYMKKRDSDQFIIWENQTANVLEAKVKEDWDGMKVYCLMSDQQGASAMSQIISVTIGESVKIVQEPSDVFVKISSVPELSVQAQGIELSYQWYVKKSTGTRFVAWYGQNKEKVNVASNESWEGMEAYCVVKDCFGNEAISRTITIHLEK